MDPLSAPALVLAALGACNTTVTAISSIYTTSKDVERLEAETRHLGELIRDVTFVINGAESTQEGLIRNISKANRTLQQVQEVINKGLRGYKPRAIIRRKTHLPTLTEDLKQVQAHLRDYLAFSHQ